MRIAIIGAGPAGLASLKYAIDDGHSCDLFEQTGSIGGTFVYTDYTDLDENGHPVHSAVYQGLITNFPKEVMALLDLPYPDQEKSYVSQSEVLNYYRSFTDHFNLRQYVQLHKWVTKVSLTEETKWSVTVLDVKTKTQTTSIYDAVFVCNGHHSSPLTPDIPGQDIFYGMQLHSHKYRSSDPYKNKRVVVIGTGPSGQDIAMQISAVAEHVFLVVSKELFISPPDNMTEKPRMIKLFEKTAVFEDGTEESVEAILYCTGYKYAVPFLEDNCGVTVDEKHIHPLFKQIVSIENPTLFFIGLPFIAIVIPLLDIQVRFALAVIGNKFRLPSKDDMMKDFEAEKRWRQENGLSENFAHQLGDGETQRRYFQALSDISGIENLPRVFTEMFDHCMESKRNRRMCYKIIDNETFESHLLGEAKK